MAFLGLSRHGSQSFFGVKEVWVVWVKREMKHNWKLSDLVVLMVYVSTVCEGMDERVKQKGWFVDR